jgi:hypothetical protein
MELIVDACDHQQSPNLNSNIKHCAALPPPLPHSVIKLSTVVISFSTFCRCSHPELNHPTLNPILTTGFFGLCLVTRRTFISSVFKYSRHEHNYNWLQISPIMWLKVLLRKREPRIGSTTRETRNSCHAWLKIYLRLFYFVKFSSALKKICQTYITSVAQSKNK